MSNKNGPVSWTDNADSGAEQKNSKDVFLRLQQGSNKVRLLTVPHQYHQHKYMVDGGKKYGYRINCSRTDTVSCPLCDKGDRPKRRWLVGVIDRKTSAYKILDISYSVFKSIKTLASQDEWGDPSKYDVDIVVDPNAGPTGYYTVVPKPPTALSITDLTTRQEHSSDDLERRTASPTMEKVRQQLEKIAEEVNVVGTAAVADEEDDEENQESFFKDYEATKAAPQKRVSAF